MCSQFQNATPEERYKIVKNNNFCLSFQGAIGLKIAKVLTRVEFVR